MAEVGHNCGICVTHTLHDAYSFIKSLRHRGREATGIAAVGDDTIDVIKWKGTVNSFDIFDLHQILPGPSFHTFLGHVRYATRGRKDKILEDAHPHVIGGNFEDHDSHVIIRNCDAAIVHNGQVAESYFSTINQRNIKTGCDTELLLHYFRERGETEVLRNIPGAYTVAIADRKMKEIVVIRDPRGMHPGVLGRKDGKFCFASEDIAFTENGGDPIEDMQPGSIYYFNADGDYRERQCVKPRPKHCMFQWQYILKRSALVDRVSARSHREWLGEQLAEEFVPGDVDFVTFAPRCPEPAAWAYHKKTGLPFKRVFYKPTEERSFQGSTAADRAKSIDENLHLLPGIENKIKGLTLLVIEDSTIRANVARRVKHLLYDVANVKKAYLVNYTPPLCITAEDGIDRGCEFGVDMPPVPAPGDTYIAKGRSLEQISEEIGMPVYYLSLKGLFRAFEKSGMPKENLCTYCIGGSHPLR